jgi:hypothetical protein
MRAIENKAASVHSKPMRCQGRRPRGSLDTLRSNRSVVMLRPLGLNAIVARMALGWYPAFVIALSTLHR